MLGPKQRQLATYVASANDAALDSAGLQWKTGEGLLRRLAGQLEARAGEIGSDHRFSGESAKAASTAFSHSAKKMGDRADEMRDGAQAFRDAAQGVRQAQKASDAFAKHSGDQPPQQPPDLTDAAAQRDWKTKNNQFWNHYGDSETKAHEAVTALQDNHTTQAAVFAKIHGETPPPPPPNPSTGHNPVHAGTPTPTTHVPGGSPTDTDPHNPPTSADHPPVHSPTPGTPHPPSDPGIPSSPSDPGIPQGPGGPTQTPLPGARACRGRPPAVASEVASAPSVVSVRSLVVRSVVPRRPGWPVWAGSAA